MGSTLLATYVGARYTWHRLSARLIAQDMEQRGATTARSSLVLRARSALAEGSSALLEAAGFWGNLLTILELHENEDTRARPYFYLSSRMLALACVVSSCFSCNVASGASGNAISSIAVVAEAPENDAASSLSVADV